MMPDEPEEGMSTAELLAEWRAAGRDTVAARAAAHVAEMALQAATMAEEAANEVEAAAQAALESVDTARRAAAKARLAAGRASEAAAILMAEAEGDEVRANYDLEVAEQAESKARDAFHDAEDRARKPRS